MRELAAYSEVQVRFEHAPEEGGYVLSARGPSGQASGTFRLPMTPTELENAVLRLSRPRTIVRGAGSPELDLARRFGGQLFDSVFSGGVRDLYRDSLSVARSEGKGLRVTLALTTVPELMHVPWEYLYDDPSFLSISTWTPVVRYLDLPRSRPPLALTRPLRILALVSTPSDVITLDVGRERRNLEEALADVISRGAVTIQWLENATLRQLQRELRQGEYHVFHFIGHGGFDAAADDGVLLLSDDTGKSRRVSSMQIGTMLADEASIRLAVLNSCEGARSSTDDPFAGVATGLIREVPAVIAMQFEISDSAAIIFAAEFYAALADGYPVDSALAEARKAIFADGNDVEWGTPVLYTRVADGRIFDISAPAEEAPDEQRRAADTAVAAATTTATTPATPVTTADTTPATPVTVATAVAAPPVREEAPETEAEGSEGRRWVAYVLLGLAAAALYLVGVFFPWDKHNGDGVRWVHITGPAAPRHTGILSSLSAVVLVVGTVAAALLARRPGTRGLAAGLMVGFGAAAAVKYFGVLGHALTAGSERRALSVVVFLALVAAGCLLVGVGVRLAFEAGPEAGLERREHPAVLPALLLLGAALLIGVGLFVRFNNGGAHPEFEKAVIPDEGWQALDPLFGALAALVLAIPVWRRRSPVLTGIVIALGAEAAALWLRYLGIPLLIQFAGNPKDVASFGAGGLIGLAGAVLVLLTGRLLWRRDAPQSSTVIPSAPVSGYTGA